MREVGFENIHRHSEFSLQDGYAKVEEYGHRSAEVGQHYLCITDHGMLAAIPRQIRTCEDITQGDIESNRKPHRLSPIFGIELYVQDKHVSKDLIDQMSPEEKKEIRKSYHLLAIAQNLTGYQNLIQLSSWAWIHGHYYKARVTHEQLIKYKEGIIFSTCCYLGEIGQAFDRGLPDKQQAYDNADQMLEKYMAMFGDKLYLEMMLLDFHKQKPYDEWVVHAHNKYHLPVITTGDCHYCDKEDSKYQRYMLMTGKKKVTLADIEKKLMLGEDGQDIFELQDTNLWMKSEKELNQKWLEMYSDVIPLELFEASKLNTVKICESAKNIKVDRESKLPQLDNEKERFLELLEIGMKWRGVWNKKVYMKRLEEEFSLIYRKGFISYFLIQKMFTDEARRVCSQPEYLGWGTGHEAVGPGRGSGVGSLCNYVLGITDVDPIKHGLLFSRFLSEARGGKVVKTKMTGPPIPI